MRKQGSNISGMNIEILSDIKEKTHFHPEIEVAFVISGRITVATRDNYYELNDKDIILFNSNSSHKIESIDNAIICRISISHKILSEIISNGNYIFYCNSVSDKVHSYTELQNIMKRIVFSYMGKEHKSECLRYGLIYELLDVLIENFQKNRDNHKYKKGDKENEQLQYIINYVNLNFQNTIHLSDLAKEMYTSQSTLSRFFKKQLGIYFGDFVNEVRLNYAVKELMETDKTITKISVDCGFSNASAFSKIFQSKYNLSPTAYRKQELKKLKSLQESNNSDLERLKQELFSFHDKEEGEKIATKKEKIEIKVGQGEEYDKFWNSVLNIGSAHNLIFANVQSHVAYLIEQLKFEHVRIWNIFSDRLMIQRTNNDFDYNFDMVDITLDFLVSSGVKPFIDFGKKPDCAIKAGEETVYYEEEYIEFNSIKEWSNMFQSFISHIIKRYGKEEVEGWKFELSLDVRPFKFYVKNEKENYEELFKDSYKYLKKHLPLVEVGGFGVVMEVNYDGLLEWLQYCKENECIPDFVSMLSFPYHQVKSKNGEYAERVTNDSITTNQVVMARNSLDKEGFEDCKLYVTEFNNSLSNRNYLNDSCFRATYVTKTINELWGIPDIMALWMGTDLVSSYYDTSKIANGGSGLITKGKIRKPVFYALLFLNRLGNRFIEKGKNYIVTSNGMGSFYILCFNYKEYNYSYFMQDEDNLQLGDFEGLFENNDDLKLEMELIGMPENQKYTIKKHIVNEKHGSILSEWSKFQYEKDIEGSDLKHLGEVCIPDLTMEKQLVEKETLQITAKLKSHEIMLIHIYEDK